MKKLSRCKAIKAINPNAEYVIKNETVDGYESIKWLNDTTPISDADIDAKLAELQAEEDAKEQAKIDNKASAKVKLVAGEALTAEEADTIVL
tara:strand:- start:5 stop:280 length:276 start_codon:yes stop_codon:yes gene_type:complete